MDSDFLKQENWPVLGQGNHSAASQKLYDWCGKISRYISALTDRVKQLEGNQTENLNEIKNLKNDLREANDSVKTSNISSNWVQVLKTGGKNVKKPDEQLVVANATINELNEREKRKKNIIIYGVPESGKEVMVERRKEDEKKIAEIMCKIGQDDVKPVFSRRLKSKDAQKPGPLLVELSDKSLRNPILLAAKKLKNYNEHERVYISPDLTEAERQLDFQLRQERNKLNAALGSESPFRYGIRGNQLQRFKKNTV